MDSQFCTACGAPAEGRRYCTNCGAAIGTVDASTAQRSAATTAAAAAVAPASAPSPVPAGARRGLSKPAQWLIGIGALVVAAVVALALVMATGRSSPTSTPAAASSGAARPSAPAASPKPSATVSPVAGAWSGTLDQPGHGASSGQDQVDPMTYAGTMVLVDDGAGRISGKYADHQTQGRLNPQSFDVMGTYDGHTLDLRGVEGTETLPPGDAFFMNHLVLKVNGNQMTGEFFKPNGTYMGTADFNRIGGPQ